MAVCQSAIMSTETPSSRASSLPQLSRLTHINGGHPGHRVRRGRRVRLARLGCRARHGCDCRCPDRRGYDRPNRPDCVHPNCDSDEPGSRLAAPTGNNAVLADTPAAGGNTAALAGSAVRAANNTGAAPCNTRRWNSKARPRSNRAQGMCRPRTGSSWLLHRNRVRTHQETIPIEQSAESGGAVFDRAWRPPGPRVSHTSDAGRRQSIIR